jgi:hypothetical protein
MTTTEIFLSDFASDDNSYNALKHLAKTLCEKDGKSLDEDRFNDLVQNVSYLVPNEVIDNDYQNISTTLFIVSRMFSDLV